MVFATNQTEVDPPLGEPITLARVHVAGVIHENVRAVILREATLEEYAASLRENGITEAGIDANLRLADHTPVRFWQISLD